MTLKRNATLQALVVLALLGLIACSQSQYPITAGQYISSDGDTFVIIGSDDGGQGQPIPVTAKEVRLLTSYDFTKKYGEDQFMGPMTWPLPRAGATPTYENRVTIDVTAGPGRVTLVRFAGKPVGKLFILAPEQVTSTQLAKKLGGWVRCDTGVQIKFAFQLQRPGIPAKWTQNSFGQLSNEGVMQYSKIEMSKCSEKKIREFGGTTDEEYDCIHAVVSGGPQFLTTTGSNEFRLDAARFGEWDLREWVRERQEYSMRGDTTCKLD